MKEKVIDEMELSASTRAYLKKNFDSVDEIVRRGRIIAFELDCHPRRKNNARKWELELTSALKASGWVRDTADLVICFGVSELFSNVYSDHESFITRVEQLSNDEYESFRIAEEDLENLKLALRSQLSEQQYEVINNRFGLNGGYEARDLKSIGQRLEPKVKTERVRQIEAQAIRRLRWRNTLPVIFGTPKELTSAKKETDPKSILVERLDLSTGAHSCLKRAGIRNVSDILEYESWSKLRNFGRRRAEEVVEKMHQFGYNDFYI